MDAGAAFIVLCLMVVSYVVGYRAGIADANLMSGPWESLPESPKHRKSYTDNDIARP